MAKPQRHLNRDGQKILAAAPPLWDKLMVLK
jgi:hypothetical protein